MGRGGGETMIFYETIFCQLPFTNVVTWPRITQRVTWPDPAVPHPLLLWITESKLCRHNTMEN